MIENNIKWLDFFSGLNTIVIKNEQDFNKFRTFLDNIGLGILLKNDREYADWQYLSKINNHDPNCIIFEYQVGKGMTFGYTKEESKEWYGKESMTVDVFDYFYENSNLFNKDKTISIEEVDFEK